MTLTISVISRTNLLGTPVPVSGTGDNAISARQSAINIAQRLHGISQPITIEELLRTGDRETALTIRRLAEQHARELVRSVQSRGGAVWYTQPSRPADCYYKR